MSFGFREIQDVVEVALDDAKSKMLFFAAANNDGLNQPELFPAYHRSVISVRGTEYDGSFKQRYNPIAYEDGLHYGTLAVDVPCAWPVSTRLRMSGCSVATPVMAAIAAAVITFVDRVDHGNAPQRHKDSVRTQEGILSIFRWMTENQKARDRRYLAPWQLYKYGDGDPHTLISWALSNLRPRQV
jgi:hypothetical protein